MPSKIVLVVGIVVILILGAVDVFYHGHFSDYFLQKKVGRILEKANYSTKDQPIKVTVKGRWVWLEGTVPTVEDKARVSDAVQRRVRGLRGITNNLLPGAAYCDQQILEQLKQYVGADPSEASISYLVDPGCNITLTGWVPTEEMKSAVGHVAAAIPGVSSVANTVEVGFPTQKVTDILVEVLRMSNIYFDHDKTEIRQESQKALEKVAVVLKANAGTRVRLEGHTDSTGNEKYNQGQSEKRSAAVRDALVQKGVEANRLEAVGFGESRPIATNETNEGRAENNRVEFKLQ